MKPGDSVRLLHSTDAGKIVKIIDNKMVEVEIEDGFVIPVLLQELVPVATEEKAEFDFKKDSDEKAPDAYTNQKLELDDILLAFEEKETGELDVFFINNSDFTVLYTTHGIINGIVHGLYNGIVNPRTATLLDTTRKKALLQYQRVSFQIILYACRTTEILTPIVKEVSWNLHKILMKKQSTPLLGNKMSQLKLNHDLIKVDPDQLKEKMMGDSLTYDTATSKSYHGPEEIVVDLHIEKLINNPSSLKPGEILEIQVNTFEKSLDNAIVTGAKRIKFIHGLGNGTLRHTIHKKLGKSPLIQYFKDTEKSRFGYGATMIYLK